MSIGALLFYQVLIQYLLVNTPCDHPHCADRQRQDNGNADPKLQTQSSQASFPGQVSTLAPSHSQVPTVLTNITHPAAKTSIASLSSTFPPRALQKALQLDGRDGGHEQEPMEMQPMQQTMQAHGGVVSRMRFLMAMERQDLRAGQPRDEFTIMAGLARLAILGLACCYLLVRKKAHTVSITQEKAKPPKQGQREEGAQQGQRKRWQGRASWGKAGFAIASLVYAHQSAAASLCWQLAQCRSSLEFSKGQSAFGGAPTLEESTQDPQECEHRQRGDLEGFGPTRNYSWEGRHSYIQATGHCLGLGEEGSSRDRRCLESLSQGLASVFGRDAETVGNPHAAVRDRRTSFCGEQEADVAETVRSQTEAQCYARENHSFTGGSLGGGRAGGAYERCIRAFHHSIQKASRCHVGSSCNHESEYRRCVSQTQTKRDGQGELGAGAADASPSLGRTARVPKDLQDRPVNKPRRVNWADHYEDSHYIRDNDTAFVETYYMPHLCWSHSVVLESDFKSPCDARQQALLLEAALDDVDFDEEGQGFCLTKDPAPQTEQDHLPAPYVTLAEMIPLVDIETLIMELQFDAEDLEHSGMPCLHPEWHSFCLHFSSELPWESYTFAIPWESCILMTTWHQILRQWPLPHFGRTLRLFRALAGNWSKCDGHHHILIATCDMPGLLFDISNQEQVYSVVDLAGFTWEAGQSDNRLWLGGRLLDGGQEIPLQCGTMLRITPGSPPALQTRVDDLDVTEAPVLDFDIDEPMVLAEDVQGRDEPIVVIRDDEDLIVQALAAYAEEGMLNLVMFGYDGESLGRRDRETLANFDAIQRAIENTWHDYPSHFIKPYLVRPQPAALAGEGLVFVIAIQHVFAGAPIPQQGCVLCLAGIQLSYAGSQEPDVHRAFALEEDFDIADVRERLQLSSLCQPVGRRQCDFALEEHPMTEGNRYFSRSGSYVTADIKTEQAIFDIQRALRDLESVTTDMEVIQQDPRIQQIRLVQHGFRFRSLGTVNQIWDDRAPIDAVSLSQHFARGWTRQPLDRMQIFRARALDSVDTTLGVLVLHFIVTFDLVPGHAACLMMPGHSTPWAIAGPHLLRPQFWAADGLDPTVTNPLNDDNHEILLFPGRAPTLLAISGDVLVYTTPETMAVPLIDDENDETDGASMLHLEAHRARKECDFAVTSPSLKPCPTFELPGPALECGRPLELFPLLWGDCCEVPLPCAKVECQQFLRACQHYPLCPVLPDEFHHYLKPITLAYLETCADQTFNHGEIHIYTDGSSFIHREDGYAEREATWAAAVFRVEGRQRCFVGWTAGFVADEPDQRSYIGATSKRAMQAERTGIFWIMAWTLGLPPGQRVHLFVDNQPACFGATGQWTFDMDDQLARRGRYITMLVSEKHHFCAHHVKSHTAQPQNELVDGIASAVAEVRNSLSFKQASIERSIAHFDDYDTLWCHFVSNGILPPVHNDCLKLLPVDEDRSFCPKLAREPAVKWSQTNKIQTALINLSVVTYNVLSLRHCDPSTTIDTDSVFPGKTKYIARQMIEARHHIFMLQECRSSHNGIFENGEIVRIVAAGLTEGIYGTEIWLNKTCPFGKVGDKPISFDRKQILVLHADPRLLVVRVKILDQSIVIISGHCPHSLDSQEARMAWWNQLNATMHKLHTKDLVICGCDFNARMPTMHLPFVGDSVCEKGNSNTQPLLEFLQAFGLFLPATFTEIHNGPNETWRHPSGQVARLDYVAIQQILWDTVVSTAWANVDAGNAIVDHSPVALYLTKHWQTSLRKMKHKAIDWEQVRAPENREKVCDLVASIPVAPWSTMPTKQLETLNDTLHGQLQHHFPKSRAGPRKPYISWNTWELRQKRCRLLRLLRLLRVGGVRHDLQLAWERWKDPVHCRSTKELACIAVFPLATHHALTTLRTTATQLKQRLRQDKAAFIAGVAERATNATSNDTFKALAPLRVGSKFKKRSIEPLPMWRHQDGSTAASHEERVAIWRNFCSDLEAGHPVTPQELLQQALDRAAQRRKDLPDLTFQEIPTLIQLEDRLRRVKRNKAAGNDGLKSDLCSIAAPQLARHLFSISTKMIVTLHEPLQSKGGTLAAAFKGSGAADHIANYRSLLLSGHLGKALRSHWRQRTMPLYEKASSRLHFAGKPGGNVSHASMILQNLLLGADKRSRSTATIFLDVSTAYYRVIRELVVHQTTSDEALARVLQRFGLSGDDFEQLWRHLQNPDILTSIGTDPRHKAILDELLSSTWFTVMDDEIVTATNAGSRPGDNLADVVFAFVYSRILEHMRFALEEEGFQTFRHTTLDDGLRSLEPCEVQVNEAPHLCDITWADDLAVILQHGDPQELLRRTKLTAGVLLDLCWRRGLLPNLKKGKTEAIVKLKGPNSKKLRLQIFGDPEPSLDVPSTIKTGVTLRLVHQYRHLGHQVPFSYKQDVEVSSRVAQARAAFALHRRSVFQNMDLSLELRAKLLNSLVMSILSFNQGTWTPLNTKSWQHYSGAVMGFYRSLLRPEVGKDQLQSWSNERVLARIKLPGPQELLHAARLRYVGSMWRTAPLEVWWAVHYGRRWFDGLQPALDWLHNNTKGLGIASEAEWRRQHLPELVSQPKQWKHLLKKALEHSVAARAVAEHLHRWHYDFLSRAVELGLQVDELSVLKKGLEADAPTVDVHPHACIPCQETFATFSAWAVHANRRHGRIAPERLLLTGSVCRVCQREYHTSRRLFRHLQYSSHCAAMLQGQEVCDQAVRPGIGNTHLERDLKIPLPVCPAASETFDWSSVEPKDVRADYHRGLYQELLSDFDAFIASGAGDEETFLDTCLAKVCNTIEPLFSLQNTVERLHRLFQDDEDQLLHRLPHGHYGARMWWQLRAIIEVAKLVPQQTLKTKLHQVQGAAYLGLHQSRFRPFRWQYTMRIPRFRSKELVVLHLFSGHRRPGDISSFLHNLPAPDGACVTSLALDIIFDPIRCDLSRRAIQCKWIGYARAGGVLGLIAGPPCESWSAARAEGGRAGDHAGDGGPRLIRSWNQPFGLEATTPDEQWHLFLANTLLLFSVDMALELLELIAFFLLEHPGFPLEAKSRDLPTIWETGPLRILRGHPAVQLHELQQGRFGAKSPKPTVFLTKGLKSLPRHLAARGTLPLPKALKLGRTATGEYSTAALKEYPEQLCAAISDSIRDFLCELPAFGTTYDLEAPERAEWIKEIRKNQNELAQMGSDRAGTGLWSVFPKFQIKLDA